MSLIISACPGLQSPVWTISTKSENTKFERSLCFLLINLAVKCRTKCTPVVREEETFLPSKLLNNEKYQISTPHNPFLFPGEGAARVSWELDTVSAAISAAQTNISNISNSYHLTEPSYFVSHVQRDRNFLIT